MKLSKLHKTLSYTSFILMVYALFCLIMIKSKWYLNNWQILDLIDTPIYIFTFIHFFMYGKKYSFNAKVYFTSVCFYLSFKVLDNYCFFNSQTFMFWNLLILVLLPCVAIIDKNLNRDE